MSFQSQFTKDNWHRGVATIAIRNGIRSRRWGMRVTVYADPTPANNGEWVLSYNEADTNIQNNSNFLKVADIGAQWGGGSFALTDGNATTANGTAVDIGGAMTDDITIDAGNNFAFTIDNALGLNFNCNDGLGVEASVQIAPGTVSVGYAANGVFISENIVNLQAEFSEIQIATSGIFLTSASGKSLFLSSNDFQISSAQGDDQLTVQQSPTAINIIQSNAVADGTTLRLETGTGFTAAYQVTGDPEIASIVAGPSDTGTGVYLTVNDGVSQQASIILQQAFVEIAADDLRYILQNSGNLIITNLPTASAGLPSGAIWSDSGTLKIIP